MNSHHAMVCLCVHHCTVYTVYRVVCSVNTVHTSTPNTNILYIEQCTLYAQHCTVYTVMCNNYTLCTITVLNMNIHILSAAVFLSTPSHFSLGSVSGDDASWKSTRSLAA